MSLKTTTKAALTFAGFIPAAPQIPTGAQRVTANIQVPPGHGAGDNTGPQQASGFITIEGSVTVPGAWVNAHAYTVGNQILDSNGNVQQCTVAGTSGGSAPSWSAELGGTTADGSGALVWECCGVPLGALAAGPCTIIVTQ